ncbi:MAG: SRPBCC family protein [Solirubrobacterales bacterium]
MRLTQDIACNAPVEAVWEYINEPANYLHFMSGMTRWEVAGERRSGKGARYRMLMRVGSAEVGGLIEIVDWRSPTDMAWTSILGVDQRGRWRLRALPDGRTKIELRYQFGVAGSGIGGWLAEQLASPVVSEHLRRSLHLLKRQVEHEQLRRRAEERKLRRTATA